MNIEQLYAMSDVELNELATIKVMGWQNHESFGWNFTTDMNDAMKLMNTAIENSKYTDVTISMPANVVILHRHLAEELFVDNEDSLPRAITIASILALE